MTLPLLLAHGLGGGDWHGVATVAAAGVLVVFVLAVVGRVTLDTPGDLVLPLAAVAIVAGVGGSLGGFVASQVGWAIPVGATLLVVLIIAATTELSLTATSPLTAGGLLVAVIATVVLYAPIQDTVQPAPSPTATLTSEP